MVNSVFYEIGYFWLKVGQSPTQKQNVAQKEKLNEEENSMDIYKLGFVNLSKPETVMKFAEFHFTGTQVSYNFQKMAVKYIGNPLYINIPKELNRIFHIYVIGESATLGHNLISVYKVDYENLKTEPHTSSDYDISSSDVGVSQSQFCPLAI